jgi:phospholipase C
VAQIGPDGLPLPDKDGAVSPDGYGINTLQSVNHPHKNKTPKDELIPNLTMPTIGDKLSEKKVSWAWYAGGWDEAMKAGEDEEEETGHLSTHHQPFVYFKNYADGTKAKRIHLRDENELNTILDGKGRLPQVSFVKFTSLDDEHPRDADVLRGQKHCAELVEKILGSKYGKDCAILITYDEHGGRWDHVAPPKVDRWGPGSRVPFIIISPFAKKGFVDHTTYTTASILKFIETRFGVEPLNERDGKANNLDNAFDLGQTK